MLIIIGLYLLGVVFQTWGVVLALRSGQVTIWDERTVAFHAAVLVAFWPATVVYLLLKGASHAR